MTSDLRVQQVDIQTLRHDPDNARTHSDRQIDALQASLREFGQRRPLICLPDMTVIAGNGTLMAAQRLGWKKVAVTILPFTDEQKVRAFAIADNRSSDLADWDEEILLDSLLEIEEAGLLAPVGYTDVELDDLRAFLEEQEPEQILSHMNEDTKKSASELLERYESRATRQIVLIYPTSVYTWIADRMARVRQENGYTSNAEVIAHLLAAESNEEAPEWTIE